MTDFRAFADRASREPLFFGHALARFCALYGLTLDDVAAEWGCTPGTLDRVRVCYLPTTEYGCGQIALRYGVPVARVREVAGV